jgi:hypothetical protein
MKKAKLYVLFQKVENSTEIFEMQKTCKSA